MESVVSSLEALLLRALPTLAILLFLHYYLKFMLFKPLDAALAERKAATAGTRKLADDAIANAEAKARQYEEAIRAARNDLFKEQEALRAQWRKEQAATVASMKARAAETVATARAGIDSSRDQAKAEMQAQAGEIAEQIAQQVLAGRAS